MVPDDRKVGADGGGLLSGVGQGVDDFAKPSTSQAFQRRTFSDATPSLSTAQSNALMQQRYGPPIRRGYDESVLQTLPGISPSALSPYPQALDFDDEDDPPVSAPAQRQLHKPANGLPVRHSSVTGGVAGYIPDIGDPNRHHPAGRGPHHRAPLYGGSSRHYPANGGPYRQNIPRPPPIRRDSGQAIPSTMMVRSSAPSTESTLARGEDFPIMSARTGRRSAR